MQICIWHRFSTGGGVVGYPSERLYEEVACIAANFHWSLADIIALDHGDRCRWVAEIERLQQRDR